MQGIPAQTSTKCLIGWPMTSVIVQSLVVGAVIPCVAFNKVTRHLAFQSLACARIAHVAWVHSTALA